MTEKKVADKTLDELMAEIEAMEAAKGQLLAKAAEIRSIEKQGVVANIKSMIEKYGITPADLGMMQAVVAGEAKVRKARGTSEPKPPKIKLKVGYYVGPNGKVYHRKADSVGALPKFLHGITTEEAEKFWRENDPTPKA